MAISALNRTFDNQNPNGNSRSINHTHPPGSDGLLVMILVMPNGTNFSSATYAGQPMTLEFTYNSTNQSSRWSAWTLANPPVGTNQNLTVQFTGGQFNPISLWAQSFIGADSTIGNIGSNDVSNTPHARNITIQQNSIIMAHGISTASFSSINIGGANRTLLYQHNINKQSVGAISPPLAAGTTNVTNTVAFGSVTNFRIEVKEANTGPVGFAEGNWAMLL